ncbi:MAG: GAF domain-containing protein [candidate division Zixibacteria bacterium]|nr:GAF domain-containing protein [candidate division Zixibacteria bacterium]
MNAKAQQLIRDITHTISDKQTETAVLQSAVELLDAYSDTFNWTGFYMMRGNVLEVGPYIGPVTEHVRIELNKGICGATATQKKSIVVDDVRSDPRFLACSLTTRSEIVVPLMDGDVCLGEIDIDSDKPNAFNDDDKTMLEEVARIIVARLKMC